MDFIEKCILKKIYLYKVWRVHVQWTPPLLLYPPPPSPHLNGNFLIKKMLNLYISEAENMAL